VREVARKLAMSEADLYRKQRVALESVARIIMRQEAETAAGEKQPETDSEAPASASGDAL